MVISLPTAVQSGRLNMKTNTIVRILYTFDAIYVLYGLATVIVGIWFFIIQYQFVELIKPHHDIDLNLFWMQIVPWVFFIIGIIDVILGFCGLFKATKHEEFVINLYCVLMILFILCQITVATLLIVYVDRDYTDEFIHETVNNGFRKAIKDPETLLSFNSVENLYKCCGANSSSDYLLYRNELPVSCCDEYFGSLCDFWNEIAVERLGCGDAVTYYTKMISSVFAGTLLFICLIEIAHVFLANKLFGNDRVSDPHIHTYYGY
ncbi:unnamed protein product [Colias eurytheme]|nr:unnamed protein product [Colias eurytheme]